MRVYQPISHLNSVRMNLLIKLDSICFEPVTLPIMMIAWSCDKMFVIKPIKYVPKASDKILRYRGDVPFMPLDSPNHSQK